MASDTTTQARSLVARLLGGDLDAVTRTAERHTLRFASPVLPLRHTPVTAVSSVTVDGEAVDSGAYSVTPFALVREDGGQWPAGSAILVTYTTGWTEGAEAQEVQDALALATEWLDAHPGTGITQFRAGEESATRESTDGRGPHVIRELLAKWRRP